jgi:uncharacterized protein
MAVAAQGLHLPRPARADARHMARTIRRLGLLQYDSVNVLVQAHYLVLFSRLGPYSRARLDRLIYGEQRYTEHWAHEASLIPIEDWPLLAYRRASHVLQPSGFEEVLAANPHYAPLVLEHVRRNGAVTIGQVPDCEGVPRRLAEKWFGTVNRATLEAHFGRGALAVRKRLPNMARVYDLTERVIPACHRERQVPYEEAQRILIAQAARAFGVGTCADFADYYRMAQREARTAIQELESRGELIRVAVEGWRSPAWQHAEAILPKAVNAARILSPFDPLVWYRPRTERLFDFHYRLEIYTPKEKRRWGYYVLPFLWRDRLAARTDLRADRVHGRLVVESVQFEEGVPKREVRQALEEELDLLCRWLELAR